eukprot:scaffold137741_cov23-Tisochrysis_lutea.AAC.1
MSCPICQQRGWMALSLRLAVLKHRWIAVLCHSNPYPPQQPLLTMHSLLLVPSGREGLHCCFQPGVPLLKLILGTAQCN